LKDLVQELTEVIAEWELLRHHLSSGSGAMTFSVKETFVNNTNKTDRKQL